MEEITSRKNKLICHLKELGASREYRHEQREYLCDGVKLLGEAVMHGATIKSVLVSGDIPEEARGLPVYKVPFDLIQHVSPLKNPQPVLFSCGMREPETGIKKGHIIVLEGVQDPGNVGTVLRTSGAFGIDCVILTGCCADPYNPKTVRASMGAVFWKCFQEMESQEIKNLKSSGIELYAAAPGEGGIDVRKADLENAAVVIGNEGRGLTEEMLEICEGRISIPMFPGCESLNAAVAAAVIMWEMTR